MSHAVVCDPPYSSGPPRASGDEPPAEGYAGTLDESAPRERG